MSRSGKPNSARIMAPVSFSLMDLLRGNLFSVPFPQFPSDEYGTLWACLGGSTGQGEFHALAGKVCESGLGYSLRFYDWEQKPMYIMYGYV